MAKRKRINVQPGEWIRPVMNDHRVICCDCGLVHSVNFKVIDDNGNEINGARVLIQAYRHEPHTKRERNKRNITVEH